MFQTLQYLKSSNPWTNCQVPRDLKVVWSSPARDTIMYQSYISERPGKLSFQVFPFTVASGVPKLDLDDSINGNKFLMIANKQF